MDARWHHVAIGVQNLDQMLYFYRDLLKFEIEWERKQYSGDGFSKVVGMPNAEAHVVMLNGHGARLELFAYREPKDGNRVAMRQCDFGIIHFTLQVTDIHAEYKRLIEQGVIFNCPPQELRTGVWATYMKDPEQNTIELVQYP